MTPGFALQVVRALPSVSNPRNQLIETMIAIYLWLLVSSLAVTAQVPLLQVSHRRFADQLIAALYGDDGNEFTSSLGVSMAFALIYPSMTGNAQNQTATVLGYPLLGDNNNDEDPLIWNETEGQLEVANDGTCLNDANVPIVTEPNCSRSEPTILIANSIWVDEQSTVDPTYEAVVREFLFQIDFANVGAGDTINRWVEEATRGLIDTIVEPGPQIDLVLIAINAIYLKANWQKAFTIEKTNQDVFYESYSRTQTVTDRAIFMHQVSSFPYAQIPGYQVLQLPFLGSEALSMVVVLPTRDEVAMLSSDQLVSVLPALTDERMAVSLPRFTLERKYDKDLVSALQNVGITAPFTGGLCFFEGDNCYTRIDEVIQKTFISVDEDGVEAAAVTAIMTRNNDPRVPIEFLADHPFQFFIVYREKGGANALLPTTELVLFEGRLGNLESENTTDLVLEDRHGENFWKDTFGVEPIVVEDMQPVPTPSPTTVSPTLAPTTSSSSSPRKEPPIHIFGAVVVTFFLYLTPTFGLILFA